MGKLAERVRVRLKEEKGRQKRSERDIGDLIQWPQSRVSQKLTGRTPITLDELEALCFALSIAPTEAIRDRGLEFCAEMTPTELRLLEYFRQLPPQKFEDWLRVFEIRSSQIESRGATKPKSFRKARV